MRVSVIIRYLTAKKNDESGIALVIVAGIIVAIGAFLALGLSSFDLGDPADREKQTVVRMENLLNHFASFAQHYGRLPCPANPAVPAAGTASAAFGQEDRPPPPPAAGCTGGRFEGIVPFRALGLQERDARDAWGNFITYAVSPVFTDLDRIADTGVNIHANCRVATVWIDDFELSVPDGATPTVNSDMRSLNPRKAKFCCPGPAGADFQGGDIRVLTAPLPGGVDLDTVIVPDGAAGGNIYQDIDTIFDPAGTGNPQGPDFPDINDATTIAIVLISHGPNGLGAFDTTGPNAKIPYAGSSPAEVENADGDTGDTNYVSTQRILAESANYYDDIVMFKNNRSLYNLPGNSSCSNPNR